MRVAVAGGSGTVGRRYARARGLQRRVLRLPLPGRVGRALASGVLLPTDPGPRGVQSFDEWLAWTSS